MQRHREIAASPRRTTAETWEVIGSLIGDTLERSPSIYRAEVDAALEPLQQLGRMLVSAGHLEDHALTLIAADVWLEISTVSGSRALTLEENLNPVPGGATATDWTLHVPQVEPMAKFVRATVKGRDHLSAGEPTPTPTTAKASAGVDLEALARWAGEER